MESSSKRPKKEWTVEHARREMFSLKKAEPDDELHNISSFVCSQGHIFVRISTALQYIMHKSQPTASRLITTFGAGCWWRSELYLEDAVKDNRVHLYHMFLHGKGHVLKVSHFESMIDTLFKADDENARARYLVDVVKKRHMDIPGSAVVSGAPDGAAKQSLKSKYRATAELTGYRELLTDPSDVANGGMVVAYLVLTDDIIVSQKDVFDFIASDSAKHLKDTLYGVLRDQNRVKRKPYNIECGEDVRNHLRLNGNLTHHMYNFGPHKVFTERGLEMLIESHDIFRVKDVEGRKNRCRHLLESLRRRKQTTLASQSQSDQGEGAGQSISMATVTTAELSTFIDSQPSNSVAGTPNVTIDSTSHSNVASTSATDTHDSVSDGTQLPNVDGNRSHELYDLIMRGEIF